jgi:hypothetical protein
MDGPIMCSLITQKREEHIKTSWIKKAKKILRQKCERSETRMKERNEVAVE